MAGASYFIWKGVDCRAKGVLLQSPLPIVRGEERVEHVAIPGRSGDLTLSQGERIINSYIQTASIAVKGRQRVAEIMDWLTGAGELISSAEPNRKQQARVIGAVSLRKHSKNLDWWEGECQFYCQPLKQALTEETITMTAAGTVTNRGDVIARPLFKLTASGGSILLQISHSSGGSTSTEALEVPTDCYIDSETGIITDLTRTNVLNNQSFGDFPVLLPGDNNYLSGSGWSSIEITKRERWL